MQLITVDPFHYGHIRSICGHVGPADFVVIDCEWTADFVVIDCEWTAEFNSW